MRKILQLTFGAALLGALFVAQAGLPLTCHPFDIGSAKSLPWSSGNNWNNPDRYYNTKNLSADTLAILDGAPSVLVRMETLRRAAIYGSIDHDASRALLAQLKSREEANEKSPKPTANAYFDYGYFLSTLKSLGFENKQDLSGGIDGYAFVEKALAIDPSSAGMHFAAAVMASWPVRTADRDEHLQKARAAGNDALLAQNISSHFPSPVSTH